jgi:hypothetical protein
VALILQQAAGQHRGVVLQRDGVGQLPGLGQDLAQQVQQFPHRAVQSRSGQAGVFHQPVVEDVLARVHRFLADKAGDGAAQFGVFHLVAVVAHAVHEEALPGGEEDRQRVDEAVDRAGALAFDALQVGMHVAADWHHGGLLG